MPMRYKIDVLNALKEKGYNTNKIRTEGLLEKVGKGAEEKVYFSWEQSVDLAQKRYEIVIENFNKKI